MANKILTQEEIDALMKGVSNGDIDTEVNQGTDNLGIKPYDLTSQDRIVRGRMPTMEIINERFSRLLRISLFNLLRKVSDVNVERLKMMKYGEFLRNIPVPASLNIFQLSPLRGLSLLVFDANLVFLIVDNYFGGSGKFQTKVEGREFTVLEQRVIRKVVDLVFHDLQNSWQAVYPVNFVYSRSEVNPQFVNVVVPTEVVIVSTFRIEIEGNTTMMSICIPYSSIEPIKEKLYAGYQSDRIDVDKRWLARLEEEVRKTSLLVSCEIGKASITIEEFLNLNLGDVIQLDRKVSDLVAVNIEGVLKFYGRTGLSDGVYALQMTELV